MATPHINAEMGDFADVVLMRATRCVQSILLKLSLKMPVK